MYLWSKAGLYQPAGIEGDIDYQSESLIDILTYIQNIYDPNNTGIEHAEVQPWFGERFPAKERYKACLQNTNTKNTGNERPVAILRIQSYGRNRVGETI